MQKIKPPILNGARQATAAKRASGVITRLGIELTHDEQSSHVILLVELSGDVVKLPHLSGDMAFGILELWRLRGWSFIDVMGEGDERVICFHALPADTQKTEFQALEIEFHINRNDQSPTARFEKLGGGNRCVRLPLPQAVQLARIWLEPWPVNIQLERNLGDEVETVVLAPIPPGQ